MRRKLVLDWSCRSLLLLNVGEHTRRAIESDGASHCRFVFDCVERSYNFTQFCGYRTCELKKKIMKKKQVIMQNSTTAKIYLIMQRQIWKFQFAFTFIFNAAFNILLRLHLLLLNLLVASICHYLLKKHEKSLKQTMWSEWSFAKQWQATRQTHHSFTNSTKNFRSDGTPKNRPKVKRKVKRKNYLDFLNKTAIEEL